MPPIQVKVVGLSKSFAGHRALIDVDLRIRRGTVHCLIGENGAGKSTLGRILAGVHRPDSGKIEISGKSVAFRSPADALASGITGMAQEVALVPRMTVADNVLLGLNRGRVGFLSRSEQRSEVVILLKDYGFDLNPDSLVGDLSIADQQKVEILKALARGSDLIVMDEPTASLGDRDAGVLMEIVRALRDRGTTIVYISHHLEEIVAIADWVTVLRDGRVVYDGSTLSKIQLVTHMLGRTLESSFPAKKLPAADAPIVIEVESLSSETSFRGISLNVRAGEIVGLAGLVGSGRSEFARAIAGVDRPSSGVIIVGGVTRKFGSPSAAMRAGVHLIPEDRKSQGLILARPVRENITYAVVRQLSRLGIISQLREKALSTEAAERTDVRATSIEDPVWALSGGNQQKVMFARGTLARPSVLIIDEPTKGVDIGAKFAIHRLVAELAASGIAIILISSEHEEVMGLAHRIFVLREGMVVEEFQGPDFPAEQLTLAVLAEAPTQTER